MDISDIENERKHNFYSVNKSLYSSTKYIPSLNPCLLEKIGIYSLLQLVFKILKTWICI
jgi:hypothetical protein